MSKTHRYSWSVTKTRRWKHFRVTILERDGYTCVQCGSRRRLEVDHILPVRTHPELGFEASNCQTLCASCHTRKTRVECGAQPLSKAREEWAKLMREPRDLPKRKQNA
ncbi:MAG: HNH endonuclease [Pseudomonadota bacterium]